MGHSLRPFTQIAHVGTGTDFGESASAIPLVDSQGNAVKCNWIYVLPVSSETDENYYFTVFVSGVNASNLIRDVDRTTSASVGKSAHLDRRGALTAVEFNLADDDAVSEIQIRVALGGACNFAISYGYKMPENPLRGSSRGRGA